MKRYIFVLVALAALIIVGIVSARNYKATIDLTPDPFVGIQSTVTGCGYDPNVEVSIAYVWTEDYTSKGTWDGYYDHVVADSDGCFSDTFTPSVHALYEIWTFQPNPAGKSTQTKSKISFSL